MASVPFPDLAAGVAAAGPKWPLRKFLCRLYPDVPPEASSNSSAPSWAHASAIGPAVLVLDVRSPAEYTHGHLPGARSVPLFDDAERVQVGLCYKHSGRFAAIQLGLSLVGPKLAPIVQRVQELGARPGDAVLVYCWRGGMRSSSICWLLGLCGYQAAALDGGYRAFRRWVQKLMHSQSPADAEEAAERRRSIGERVASAIATSTAPPTSGGGIGGGVGGGIGGESGDGTAADYAAERAAVTAVGSAAGDALSWSLEAFAPESARTYGEHFGSAKVAKERGEWEAAAAEYATALALGHPQVMTRCLADGLMADGGWRAAPADGSW